MSPTAMTAAKVMVVTQCTYLAASALLLFGFHSVPAIYGCLLLTACARTFQGPARGAMLPQIVPPEALGNAITWNSSAQEIASVSGPALAGVLLATSGKPHSLSAADGVRAAYPVVLRVDLKPQ